jgi:hypothetical protein
MSTELTLEEQLNAAIAYARTESSKAQSAEHWRQVTESRLERTQTARNQIYKLLKASGYVDGSYGELKTPAPEFKTIVAQDKRATAMEEILQIVTHLLQDEKGGD